MFRTLLAATAVIAIAACSNAEELTRDVFGGAIGFLPWQRPGFELGLGLFRKQPRLVGRIRHPRLVDEQPGGHFLEAVEHLQMRADTVGDARHVTGDVAAFHRQ